MNKIILGQAKEHDAQIVFDYKFEFQRFSISLTKLKAGRGVGAWRTHCHRWLSSRLNQLSAMQNDSGLVLRGFCDVVFNPRESIFVI